MFTLYVNTIEFEKLISLMSLVNYMNSKSGTYQDDLLKQLGGGLGGIFQVLLPVSFSANVAYQRTRYKISKEHYLFVKTENQCNVFELQLDKNKPPKFTEQLEISAAFFSCGPKSEIT